jgi:acyl carrier protein
LEDSRDAMNAAPSPELKLEIKKLILSALKISDVLPQQINDDASLFENNSALTLDSVDALEIVMVLQRTYGVHLDDRNQSRFIIRSISSIAEFITREQGKKDA